MDLTTYAENFLIDHLLRGQGLTLPTNVYLGVFSSATDEDGGGTEAAGGSYARQVLSMGEGGDIYTAVNDLALLFPNMPAGTWTHTAIFDAVSGGNMLFHGALDSPKTTAEGQPLPIAAGAVQTVLSGHLGPAMASAIYAALFGNTDMAPTTILLHLLTNLSPVVEVSGGAGYEAQELVVTSPIDGVTWNEGVVTFDDVDTGGADITSAMISHEGMWLLLSGPLVSAIPDPGGGQVIFDLGDFQLTLR